MDTSTNDLGLSAGKSLERTVDLAARPAPAGHPEEGWIGFALLFGALTALLPAGCLLGTQPIGGASDLPVLAVFVFFFSILAGRFAAWVVPDGTSRVGTPPSEQARADFHDRTLRLALRFALLGLAAAWWWHWIEPAGARVLAALGIVG